MAEIYFRINADFEKVQLLRTKIDELTEKLKNMDQATDPKGFRKLEKQLQTTTKEFNSLVSQAAIAGAQLKKANQDAGDSTKGFGDLNSILMKIGGTAALTKLGSDIVQVRGEFQQLEIAFTTLLGSKEKSDALMSQMVDTAMKTPYSLQGVASGARQLLAYGFAAEDVNDVLVRLGNVASGLGLPLERLTYLYGTTRVQGRLYARDMLQFTSSGIPLLQKLADMYGVSTDKINDMVTAGKIGFSDVEKVFKSMTDQGGMFYNLMENQSKSFTGQISNDKDQISKILNDIGKSNEDLINGGLSGVKTLLDNYEAIGKMLVGLVATYGTYKTAVMIVTTVQKEQAAINAMIAASNGVFNTSLAAQWLWTERLQKAQAFLNKTMLSNPYVAVATAIVGVIAVTWALSDSTTSAEKAQKDFNASMEAQKQQLDETENKAKSLIETIKSETTTQYDKQKALQTLQRMMPSIFRNMDIETLKLMKQVSLYKQLAEWKNRQALIGAKTNAILQNQEIARLEKEKKNGPTSSMETPEAFNARMDKQIEKAKALRSLYEKSVDEINSISKKAAFNAQPKSVKLQSLNSDKSSLEADIKRLEAEKQKAEKEGRFFGSQYLLTAKRGQLSEINKTISSLNSTTKKTVLDKSYWDDLKKSATESIGSIDSNILRRLKKGKTSGIDKSTIELYKKSESDLKKAKDNLSLYDTTGKDEKAAAKAELEREVTAKKIQDLKDKQAREQARKSEDLQEQFKQSEIDKLKDGAEKTLAQLKLNHEKEMIELKRQREDYLQKKIDNRKAIFDANPKNKGKQFDSSKIKLSLGEDAAFDMLESNSRIKYRKDLADTYKNILSDYKTYSERRLEIQKDYDEKRKALKEAGGTKENFDQLNYRESKDLESIDLEFANQKDTFQVWMNQIADMSLEQLLSTLKKAENALVMAQMKSHNSDGSIKDTNQVATLRAQIKSLTNRINTLQSEDKTKRTVKEWKDTEEVLSKVNGELQEIGKNVGGATGELISFAGELSTNAVSMINSIVQLSEINSKAVQTTAIGAAKAIKTVEKASVILAIVSAALQILEKIKSAISTDASDKYELEFQKNKLDLQLRYNEALAKQLALQDKMFGGNKFSNALAYIAAYYKALNNYEEQYENAVFVRQKKTNSWAKIVSPVFGGTLQSTKTYTVNARENMQVQTRKGNFWHHSKYANLEDWLKENGYGNLFSSDGSLNLDLAKSVVTMDNLTDETKKYLQSLIDCQEQVNEMNESLKEYIDYTFGELGDDMTNVIVDAFKNGTDAAYNFKKDIVKVLEDVGAQMARSLFVQKYITAYSDALTAIYQKKREGTEQEKTNAIASEVTQATSDYFKNLTDAQQQSDDWLKQYKEMASKYGFDLYSNTSSQDSTSGSFQTMSQDQGRELDGRFTALQMAGEEIKTQSIYQSNILTRIDANVGQLLTTSSEAETLISRCADVAGEIRDLILNSFYELQKITKNTGSTSDNTSKANDYLKKIADKL